MHITPAILANTEQEFHDRIVFAHQLPEGRWHIDVLDGSRHGASCWHDANRVGDIPDLPDIELHLMIQDPFSEILQWHRAVRTLRRVLLEADLHHLPSLLQQIQALSLDISLVLNPDTPPDVCAPYTQAADEIVIMGVHPGASGREFLGDAILAKILRARALFPSMDLAIDGGVREELMPLFARVGITRSIASSALWKAASPSDAHLALQESAKIVL